MLRLGRNHTGQSEVATQVVANALDQGMAALATAARDRSAGARSHAEVDVAMERYAGGDDAAFAIVYDAIAPRIYGYLRRHTRDSSCAEDLVQQTMLHIHRARTKFIAGAQVTPWAFAIARRLMLDGMRRAKREGRYAAGDPDSVVAHGDAADDVVHARDLAERMGTALAKLPESQRVAFELLKQEGLSVAEAAEALGTTEAAVKLRAHRAYEALRHSLGEAMAPLEEGEP